MSNCNVQCGRTPYHTYQNSIGKLSIYNANPDPLGQAQGIVLPVGTSLATFTIPKMSILLGWYQCDFNANLTLDPSLNLSYRPLDAVNPAPVTQQYIAATGELNVLENEIVTTRSTYPDEYTTLPRMMQKMNQLGFFTCDFAKMIANPTTFMNGNPNRNINIRNDDLLQSFIAAPVYIDLSWIYGTNS